MTEGRVRRIIFSNNRERLEKLLVNRKRKIRYLILDGGFKHQDIKSYLAGLQECEEVGLAEETRKLRPTFRAKYIDLIADLNQANDSLSWWTFYFTRKECAFTNFAQRIFFCVLIGEVIKRSSSCDNVIVTDDPLIAKQMGDWATGQGIESVNALRLGWRLRERVKSFTLARMAYTLLEAFHYWVMLRARWRISVSQRDGYVVFGSLIGERCFSGDGDYTDTYLGELPEFMSRNGTPVLVYGGILKDTWKCLNAMRKKQPGLPILPWHYYGTFLGILDAAWRTLCRYLSPIQLKGAPEIDGISVDYLIKDVIKGDIRSGHYFASLWLYNSARELAKRVKVTACVFPYENRSWEKMLLAGLTSEGKSIRTVGYHHATISPAHTHLLLGPREAQVIPLPDKIVLVGEITKGLLEDSGNYPDQMLKVGCALRQGRKAGDLYPRNEEQKVIKVLVALANSVDEYVDTLIFLDQALLGDACHEIGIRPHPEFSLDRALARVPDLKLKFKPMGGTLESNFDWADVVVYVSSTVGLDALSVGIPAVSIDLGKFVGLDPIPEDCPLKWSAAHPNQLIPAFQKIEMISQSKFESLQVLAEEFGNRYFYPVTDERLKAFGSLVMNPAEA